MFNSSSCTWCELWEDEVGVIYEKTDEGKNLPLRRVSVHDERPVDLEKLKGVMFTPTFVLLNNGREIGRIIGYPGEAHFWGLLDELFVKLGASIQGCKHTQQMARSQSAPTSTNATC
ncbi:MAG: hypothetical protein O3A85_07440 [Proteobacteria bacterium]|nr:hypothetical protein [Pseudomonadota bacterium]